MHKKIEESRVMVEKDGDLADELSLNSIDI